MRGPARRILQALGFCLTLAPGLATAAFDLRLTEGSGETLQVRIAGKDANSACGAFEGETLLPLNSEVSDNAVYLKAARMGGGIYVHLPYFVPASCNDAVVEVRARHILWNGAWHTGTLTLPAGATRDKSIFFTNEAAPVIRGAVYFDPSIPATTMARLDSDFAGTIAYFRTVLKHDPMRDVGVVVAVVHNQGGYTGFGGDALNIIRMSVDNPSPQQLAAVDKIFPITFAHELAHKLQSVRLFELPQARYIVEGSADFLKLLVLRSAGLLGEEESKEVVRKAIKDCAGTANAVPLRERTGPRPIQFREPYDCGMVYYFVAYYSSGLSIHAFIQSLRTALAGLHDEGDTAGQLCFHLQAGCRNAHLNRVLGAKEDLLRQAAWLESQLLTRPLPLLPASP